MDVFDQPLNRGQKKAASHALRDFAAELVALQPARLDRLGLEDDVRRAIAEAQRLDSLPARNRQLLIVRKLLESADIEALKFALKRVDHARDQLVETLLRDGDEAIYALAEKYDRDALQRLRREIRAARLKMEAGTPKAAVVGDIRACLATLT